jgi:hypothetical protein
MSNGEAAPGHQHAPRVRIPISTAFQLLIFYGLITLTVMFVLIMADSGKSRTRNMHKYLFGVTSAVIEYSHLLTFWVGGVASFRYHISNYEACYKYHMISTEFYPNSVRIFRSIVAGTSRHQKTDPYPSPDFRILGTIIRRSRA